MSLDVELLISHLSGPLDPNDRPAFRHAPKPRSPPPMVGARVGSTGQWSSCGAAISIRRLMVVVPLGTSERISRAPSLPVRLRSNTVATFGSTSSN
jgi:hypothetical protein